MVCSCLLYNICHNFGELCLFLNGFFNFVAIELSLDRNMFKGTFCIITGFRRDLFYHQGFHLSNLLLIPVFGVIW
ncbi:hypothetical protein RchiOBHm_Chr1g0366391 [Rosa chinensis]|uniref:Uncharacterized protein n=1 Tax=Rosa chinensis TaxID=74649 RepID=A0A2P6SK95_ROSCH|nr:hypothetical protein RchiOBHm_Chr1g0366391 [Rosa chinensis]